MSVLAELTEHPFTREFPSSVLERLADVGTAVHYSPTELVLKKGERADRFLLIVHGKATVVIDGHDGRREVLQTLGPGEVVGWSWLLDPNQCVFDVLCQTRISGVEFDGQVLRQLMDVDHEVGYQIARSLLAVVAGRLHATRLRLLDLPAPKQQA
jgi:CRP-like cAMP-binding protein